MKFFDKIKKKSVIPQETPQFKGSFDQFIEYLSWKKGNRYVSGTETADLIKAYYGTIYACISRRAKGVTKTGWRLYTTDIKTPKSKVVTSKKKDYLFSFSSTSLAKSLSQATDMVEITQDPILDLLHKVNSLHNQSHLKGGTVIFPDIYGDGYWYVMRNEKVLNEPFAIRFLFPQYMTPIEDRTEGSKTYGDVIKYEYRHGAEKIDFPADKIVHFTYFNPHLGLTGFSPTRAACESISLDYAMTDYLFDLVSNRLKTEMLLTSDTQLQQPTIELIQAQMKEYRSNKKDKIPILPGSLKPILLTGNARDLPFIANRKFERELICNVFDVPIAMFTTESSNRAVQTEIKTEFAEYAILPLCENIQETLNQSFISMFQNSERKFIAFDDPVPSNRELELAERTGYTNSGIRYIDEIREEMNLEPVGIDYPMINGQRIGESPAEEGKAFADSVMKRMAELEKGEK